MQVPLCDLTAQYLEAKEEIDTAFHEAAMKSAFIGGEPVKKFETELASSFGLKHAVGVSNCTAALSIVLKSLALQPGDEVITTVHTAAPTAEAITLAGGRIVFCDIEEATFQIDPKAVEAAITPRTRALLPVHLYGLSVRLRELLAIAEKHHLILIEDCAQAQGTLYDGKPVGTYGAAGCLSFFPSKNLGAFGDGGAVVTDNDEIARFVRMYSNHGRQSKFDHTIQGANERLDALQAAIMLPKLRRLAQWNERRRQAAEWYRQRLADVEEVRLPQPIPECTPTWHLYVIRTEGRDALAKFLKDKGVGTGLHYPMPLNLQPAFASLNKPAGSFPVAEWVTQQEILSLPMYPHLREEQVDHVCAQIREYIVSMIRQKRIVKP